jgi:transcriptional regulator with XRE-family HTH domain
MLNPTNLRMAMVRSGMNQQQLAKASGASEGTISSILNGGDPQVSTLTKISEALGCESEAEFFTPKLCSKLQIPHPSPSRQSLDQAV